MKAVSVFLVSFLSLVAITFANHPEETSIVSDTGIIVNGKTIKAGTTPDSFLYGLDIAIDQLRYLLTFDKTTKARVGLEIARERLLEVREMILENKTDAAQRAQNEHARSLEKVKSSISALSRKNATQEIKEVIELEKELEEHEEEVETISEELKIKIEVKGKITPEQQSLIDSVLTLMQNKTGEVKIKIENKKGETKIKIKAETGKSEIEIEQELEELEERVGLAEIKRRKANERIEDASEEITEVKEKLLKLNVTNVTIPPSVFELLSQSEEKLSNAQNAFNETNFGEAFGQANVAKRLAKNAEKLLEKLEEIKEVEKEIEVEIEEGTAKVKIKIGDNKLRYILPTENETKVLEDVASKTGLPYKEISNIAKIKIGKEESIKPVEISKSKSTESIEKESKELKED